MAPKESEELYPAVLAFLNANGLSKAAKAFSQEAKIGSAAPQ